jgi:TPR repeat protein
MAALQGYAPAQGKLGFMYDTGAGIPEDDTEAVKWYRKAAEQGYGEAVKWFHDAALRGDAVAQYTIGVMYAEGNDPAQSHAEAVKWYRMAAEQGHARAQTDLGAMYARGAGVIQDWIQAYAWFDVAAANGNPDAARMRNLVTRELTDEQFAEALKVAREYSDKYRAK